VGFSLYVPSSLMEV